MKKLVYSGETISKGVQFVYALRDMRCACIRYVGSSVAGTEAKRNMAAGGVASSLWRRHVDLVGGCIEMVVLETPEPARRYEREAFWMAEMLDRGEFLTNNCSPEGFSLLSKMRRIRELESGRKASPWGTSLECPHASLTVPGCNEDGCACLCGGCPLVALDEKRRRPQCWRPRVYSIGGKRVLATGAGLVPYVR